MKITDKFRSRRFITIEEAAQYLGVSKEIVRREFPEALYSFHSAKLMRVDKKRLDILLDDKNVSESKHGATDAWLDRIGDEHY